MPQEQEERHKTTRLTDNDGNILAELTWEGEAVTNIRLGQENLEGNCQIFDVDFIKVFPDETLVPTRMEFVWRITPDALELLDDDREVVGTLHTGCVYSDGQLTPSKRTRAGRRYLEFTGSIPADELLEIIVTFLLISTLRERMYWVMKFVYGREARLKSDRNPLHKLRRRAARSFVNLRDTLLRKSS